ncbi:MAG: hypothetical protein OEV94_06995 [Deltaproteobacteria bacterium]|nr:hypothetical protein [Deltaproteobacteria bacterium]
MIPSPRSSLTGRVHRKRLDDLLESLVIPKHSPLSAEHAAALAALAKGAGLVVPHPNPIHDDSPKSILVRRKNVLERVMAEYVTRERETLQEFHRNAFHSFQTLHRYTFLLDGLLAALFQWSVEELPLLAAVKKEEVHQELSYKEKNIPQKEKQLSGLRQQMPALLLEEGGGEESRSYYRMLEKRMKDELETLHSDVAKLQRSVKYLSNMPPGKKNVEKRLVVFARGGYGRGEMSFRSDMDTGYALDPKGLVEEERMVYREVVIRMEELLAGAGLVSASQYFELGEDLTRFFRAETIHTVPALLESRTIAGNAKVLELLRAQFRRESPLEVFLRQKMEDFAGLPFPESNGFDVKNESGGLRTMQIPLWIYSQGKAATGSQMGERIRSAFQDGLLSMWEAATLAKAQDMFYDLRNVICEDDPSGGTHDNNYVGEQTVARYCREKNTALSPDDVMTRMLRMAADVRRIGQALMERVLDHTLVQTMGGVEVSVHLGRQQIISFSEKNRKKGDYLLPLFAYIARTGYDLTLELKDKLSEDVSRIQGVETKALDGFNQIFSESFCHLALESMFEVNDPLSPQQETLIGRFLPACDRLFYLMRTVENKKMAVHRLMLDALAAGQDALNKVLVQDPEWRDAITPNLYRALRWALFLHPVGLLSEQEDSAQQSSEEAVKWLTRLGYRDVEWLARVGMLITRRQAMVDIIRTTTYFDQALMDLFEMAERKVEFVLLLYAMNAGVLTARKAEPSESLASIRHLMEEAMRILSELRGVPEAGKSHAVISAYLDRKKEELIRHTRQHLLVAKTLSQGLKAGLYDPLERLNPPEKQTLRTWEEKIESAHRELLLGQGTPLALEKKEQGLANMLSQGLSEESLVGLLAGDEKRLSWFIHAFPNRYLLRRGPRFLAAQSAKFLLDGTQPVQADVVYGPQGQPESVLVHTRGVERSHARVAYALSLRHLNILEGKVNKVVYQSGDSGFCYYFQVTPLNPGEGLFARDLETAILDGQPPGLLMSSEKKGAGSEDYGLDFLEEDGKGYLVVETPDGFYRKDTPFPLVRLRLKDQPFLFLKAVRLFEQFQVSFQQALITTTGIQVMDYFYLKPSDYETLQGPKNVKKFLTLMDSGIV